MTPDPDKKVALLGFAESYKECPFDDDTIEVWGLNELYKYLPRWSRWFELHDAETLGVTKIRPAGSVGSGGLEEGEQKRHLEWLKQDHGTGKPIYMQDQFCVASGSDLAGEVVRFPNATPYPLQAMCERFGRYFTSTIGYMVALAIADGYGWIGMYGIDLVSDIEYPGQRPNTEYLVGIARGMGITVEIAPSSALCRAGHLYGYEQPIGEKAGLSASIKQHRDTLTKKHEECLATLHTLDGAIQECTNTLTLMQFKERGTKVENY